MEPYLSINIDRFIRNSLTKFRLGISDIAIHRQRYKSENSKNVKCPLCNADKEDEIHFVFICPVLADLRTEYIPLKYYSKPSLFKLILLFSSRNDQVITNFTTFLYKAFKRRSTLC